MASDKVVGKTVVCSNCQGTLTYGDKQCSYCGAALSWPEDQQGKGVVAQPIVINVVQQPQQPQQPPPPVQPVVPQQPQYGYPAAPVAPQPTWRDLHPSAASAEPKSRGKLLVVLFIVSALVVVVIGALVGVGILLWPTSNNSTSTYTPNTYAPNTYAPSTPAPQAPVYSPPVARVTASEYCSQADMSLRSGDAFGAETAARNALAAGGDNRTMASAHYLLGFAFERQGRAQEAIGEYQTSLNLRPNGTQADRVRRRLTGLRGY